MCCIFIYAQCTQITSYFFAKIADAVIYFTDLSLHESAWVVDLVEECGVFRESVICLGLVGDEARGFSVDPLSGLCEVLGYLMLWLSTVVEAVE